jgi:hypothetical protein
MADTLQPLDSQLISTTLWENVLSLSNETSSSTEPVLVWMWKLTKRLRTYLNGVHCRKSLDRCLSSRRRFGRILVS